MQKVKLAGAEVSRFLIGSNPFSGFSHISVAKDKEMVGYYTVAKIKETLREAERLGITGVVARADHHVIRLLREYWDEGGKIKWMAQTCPGVGPSEMCVKEAAGGGAVGVHVHGGVMDYLVAQKQLDEAKRAVETARKLGMAAGIAGHTTAVFELAEKELDVDYYMCCYYNPTPRENSPEHVHGAEEKFRAEDRARMAAMIKTLSRPVIHYKIMAAGRNDPEEAFSFCCSVMRPGDAVCIGVYTAADPKMIAKDVALFEKYIGKPA